MRNSDRLIVSLTTWTNYLVSHKARVYSNTIHERECVFPIRCLACTRLCTGFHTHTRARETCVISACTYILIRTSGTVRNTFETRREVRSRLRASPASASADPQDPATANNWKRRQSSRYSWQRNRSSQHEERAISSLVVDTAGAETSSQEPGCTRALRRTLPGKTARPVIDLQRSTVSTFRYNLPRHSRATFTRTTFHARPSLSLSS